MFCDKVYQPVQKCWIFKTLSPAQKISFILNAIEKHRPLKLHKQIFHAHNAAHCLIHFKYSFTQLYNRYKAVHRHILKHFN